MKILTFWFLHRGTPQTPLPQTIFFENPDLLADERMLIDTGLFKRNVWARGCLFKRLIAV